MADKKKPSNVNLPNKKGGNPSGPKPILAPTRIKIISMGAGASGKSCLIKRYCEDRFVTKYIATIGVDYGGNFLILRLLLTWVEADDS
jgi:DnaJ family protein C protein 27